MARATARRLTARRCAVIDTETTGLGSGAEAVEIAVVELLSGAVLFDSLLRPTQPVEASALAVHGIGVLQLANAPAFGFMWPALYAALRGVDSLIAYNAKFDQRILVSTGRLAGLQSAVSFFGGGGGGAEWTCAMQLAWAALGGHGRWPQLASAARDLGLRSSDTHRAVGDAQLTRQVFLKIAGVI